MPDENTQEIDIEEAKAAALAEARRQRDKPWGDLCVDVANGVLGALSAFGEPTEAELAAFFDRAMRFTEDGANELDRDIAGWASEQGPDALEQTSSWREGYSRAVSATARGTFISACLLVHAATKRSVS